MKKDRTELDKWQIILHQTRVVLTDGVMEAESIIYKDRGVYIEIGKVFSFLISACN